MEQREDRVYAKGSNRHLLFPVFPASGCSHVWLCGYEWVNRVNQRRRGGTGIYICSKGQTAPDVIEDRVFRLRV